MKYHEEVRDLFSVPEDYYLAHCISADFGMGAGIVVEFNKRFDMKNKLQAKYPHYLDSWKSRGMHGDCILEGRVLNLITKERVFQKPTYGSMRIALEWMKFQCKQSGITKVAAPVLGCGLDCLKWDEVSKIIQDVFRDTDMEILICKLQ